MYQHHGSYGVRNEGSEKELTHCNHCNCWIMLNPFKTGNQVPIDEVRYCLQRAETDLLDVAVWKISADPKLRHLYVVCWSYLYIIYIYTHHIYIYMYIYIHTISYNIYVILYYIYIYIYIIYIYIYIYHIYIYIIYIYISYIYISYIYIYHIYIMSQQSNIVSMWVFLACLTCTVPVKRLTGLALRH